MAHEFPRARVKAGGKRAGVVLWGPGLGGRLRKRVSGNMVLPSGFQASKQAAA